VLITLTQHTLPFLVLSSLAEPGSRQLDDCRSQPGAELSLATPVTISPVARSCARSAVLPKPLPTPLRPISISPPELFLATLRSADQALKDLPSWLKDCILFSNRRVPPGSDSLREPVCFLGYRGIRLFNFPQQAGRRLGYRCPFKKLFSSTPDVSIHPPLALTPLDHLLLETNALHPSSA
jgi:hypothetical protein